MEKFAVYNYYIFTVWIVRKVKQEQQAKTQPEQQPAVQKL